MTNEELVARIQAHNNEKENMLALWKQNRKMVFKIALKYTYASELEDLVQEGYFGLRNAVKYYDASRGVPFLSYAIYWIRQGMKRYVDNCCNVVRLPSNAVDSVRKYRRMIAEYEKYYGDSPSDIELAELLGVSWGELQTIKENALKTKIDSLDRALTNEDEEISLGDTVPCNYDLEENIIDKLDHERMREELWGAVEALPAVQSEPIKKKYIDNMSYREIGEQSNVSGSTIAVRVHDGLRRLRGGKSSKSLRMYHDEFFPTVSVEYKGVGSFLRDWTSSTERQALRDLERLEKKKEQRGELPDKEFAYRMGLSEETIQLVYGNDLP